MIATALQAAVTAYIEARQAHQEAVNRYIEAQAALDAEYEVLLALEDPDAIADARRLAATVAPDPT